MREERSDAAAVNKTAIALFTALVLIVAIPYLVHVLSGKMHMSHFIPIVFTDLIPVIIGWVIYHKDNGSPMLKHVLGIGYGLFYTVVCMLTNSTILVFFYAIPALIIVSVFSDFKFSVWIGIGVSVIAAIHAFKYAAISRQWGKGAKADLEIEILLMIVTSVFMIIVNKYISDTNDSRLKEINEAGKKTQKMLDGIIQISNALIDDTTAVSDKMEKLAESGEGTLSAMQEVQESSANSSRTVQTQLVKTEEIQHQIDNVTKTSENIGINMSDTVEAIHEGRDKINKLMEQVKISEEAGSGAVKEVEGLKVSTEQMESIVALIKSVASQTSLLALNASIEAARAGETGRGFAVVAQEISNLADQTQNATANISSLIEEISNEIGGVVDVIHSLVESNNTQIESAQVTAASFDKIVESVRRIRTNSGELSDIVKSLAAANDEIVESNRTISAITEEVSSHSTTTCTATENNQRTVREVQDLVVEMTSTADRLQNIME